jgi:hypothetical protein
MHRAHTDLKPRCLNKKYSNNVQAKRRSRTRRNSNSAVVLLVLLTMVFFVYNVTLHTNLLLRPLLPTTNTANIQYESLHEATVSTRMMTDLEIAFQTAKLRWKRRYEPTNNPEDTMLSWMVTTKQRIPKNLEELKNLILSNHTTVSTNFWYSDTPFVINSIRIPKSASSSLSVIARALAGCQPDGYPCCQGRGHPPGSCPRPDLFCPLVRGCVNHKPNYPTAPLPLINTPIEPIITFLRHPKERLLSSFFYHPPHRPKNQCFTFSCFQSYVQSSIYQNILTKMVYGIYAYDSLPSDIPSSTILQHAKRRLCHKRTWFGLVDREIASQLLLYETPPFSYLEPNPVVFSLPAVDSENVTESVAPINNHNKEKEYLRINESHLYRKSKLEWEGQKDFSDFIKSHNDLDYDLYQFAEQLFCARLKESGLLSLSAFFKVNPFEKCEPEQQDVSSSNNDYMSTLSVQQLCFPFS